jgi:hypothetical protein
MLVKRRRAPVYNFGTRRKYIVLYACSAWMCQDVLGFFAWMGFRTGGVLRAYKTPLDWFFWRCRDAEC